MIHKIEQKKQVLRAEVYLSSLTFFCQNCKHISLDTIRIKFNLHEHDIPTCCLASTENQKK